MSIFNELNRRKVFKVGFAYLFIAWLVAQVLQLVFESFGTPGWAIKTVLVVLAAGFPLALFLAWAYEITADEVMDLLDILLSEEQAGKSTEK